MRFQSTSKHSAMNLISIEKSLKHSTTNVIFIEKRMKCSTVNQGIRYTRVLVELMAVCSKEQRLLTRSVRLRRHSMHVGNGAYQDTMST